MISMILVLVVITFLNKDIFFFSSDILVASEQVMLSLMVLFSIFLVMTTVNFYSTVVEGITYKIFYMFSCFMVIGTIISKNMFMFLVMMELTIYPMFATMVFYSKSKDKITSALSMMIMNMLGSVPFMTMIPMNSNMTFSLWNSIDYVGEVKDLSMFLMFIIIMAMKMPVMVLHIWLTKAHVSASGPTSMILASIMIKMPSAGMVSFSKMFCKIHSYVHTYTMSLSLLTLGWFSIYMFRIFDVKLLVAMSSVSHVSFMMPLLSHYKQTTVTPMLMMMLSHAMSSSMLFYLLSLMYESSGGRSMFQIKLIESCSKIFSKMFCIWLIVNFGFPPLMSFLSEFLTLPFFLCKSQNSVVMALVFMTVMVLYLMTIMTQMIMGKGQTKKLGMINEKFLQNSIFGVLLILAFPLTL